MSSSWRRVPYSPIHRIGSATSGVRPPPPPTDASRRRAKTRRNPRAGQNCRQLPTGPRSVAARTPIPSSRKQPTSTCPQACPYGGASSARIPATVQTAKGRTALRRLDPTWSTSAGTRDGLSCRSGAPPAPVGPWRAAGAVPYTRAGGCPRSARRAGQRGRRRRRRRGGHLPAGPRGLDRRPADRARRPVRRHQQPGGRHGRAGQADRRPHPAGDGGGRAVPHLPGHAPATAPTTASPARSGSRSRSGPTTSSRRSPRRPAGSACRWSSSTTAGCASCARCSRTSRRCGPRCGRPRAATCSRTAWSTRTSARRATSARR